jgi:hypothetical protein
MSKLEEVEALLRGEQPDERESEGIPAEPEDAPESEPTGEDESAQIQEAQAKPAELKVGDIADKLGLSKSEVYELLKVKLPGGQEYTLANLKDMAAQSHIADERRTRDYNAMMVERKQTRELAEHLGQFDPAIKAKVEALSQQRQQAEMQALRAVLPEWDTPATAAKEIDAITKYASQYGIDKGELDVLVTDHRLLKLIRDNAVRPVTAPPAPRSTAPRRQEPTGSTKQDKLSAISRLIGA